MSKEILIFSGGGIRGISHLGAIKALTELNMITSINTIVCTSVGSIVGTLYCIGYLPDELLSIVVSLDMNKCTSIHFESLITSFGLDNGNKIISIIEELLKNKDINIDINFKDLYEKTKKELIITVFCINNNKVQYLSYKNTPKVSILQAIKMAISIPIYFTPEKYNNCLYCDAGIIMNYPIKLFEDKLDKIIGILICDENKNKKIDNIENYIIALLSSIGKNELDEKYKDCTVIINSNINILNFSINNDSKNKLFKLGYEAAMKKFKKN